MPRCESTRVPSRSKRISLACNTESTVFYITIVVVSLPLTPAELYLRHLRVDEAMYRLEQFLSDAFMARHRHVRIVHGKGAGLVRRAVWERLASHTLVRSYHTALPGDGDTGVTVVELEER